jgi:hypothetical protein
MRCKGKRGERGERKDGGKQRDKDMAGSISNKLS